MIEQLPEGKSIGWMQAPPQWIFTHTVRFMGIVRVVIQDGEGFILIKKGTPLVYYFKHGRIELRGRAALDYFKSHPIIEFNLCKYTPEEFTEALKICNFEERVEGLPPNPDQTPEQDSPFEGDLPASPAPPVSETPPAAEAPPAIPAVSSISPAPMPSPVSQAPAVEAEEEAPELPEESHGEAAEEPVTEEYPELRYPSEGQEVPPAVVLDEPDMKIIGQMKRLNGIVAISVFNDDRNILLMGDVAIEPLLRIARTMLETTRKIDPLLDWGSFVHMTLQIPEGNVIIAPYHENYLCILTTRTINIGHIRRILRDLQQNSNGMTLI
jgi:hypothetical protein